MTALPGKFKPIVGGLSVDHKQLKSVVQLGDGYVQVAINSVNPDIKDIDLRFILWGQDDLKELVKFFRVNKYLDYKLPEESENSKYLVTRFEVSYRDLMTSEVSVSGTQVYN